MEKTGICLWCGKEFKQPKFGPKKLYCDNKCGQSHRWYSTKITTFTCAWCGKEFEAEKKRTYCCAEHRLLANGQKKPFKERKNVLTKQPGFSIERINDLARKEGLSYGQYVAKYKLP